MRLLIDVSLSPRWVDELRRGRFASLLIAKALGAHGANPRSEDLKMPGPELNSEIKRICTQMETFEATQSVANTGTGARREGEDFERLIARLWVAFRRVAETGGAQVEVVAGVGARRYAKLTVGQRSMFIPTSASDGVTDPNADPSRWFSLEHACTVAEYTRFLTGLLSWLFQGTPRAVGSAR
ncbi:MAG: hypothetical protein HYV63_05665 [Candidatus Schekmanbacteria bacterium]|nr:hypothetical protein [Candidatus Schekmanbacteria bacterium]